MKERLDTIKFLDVTTSMLPNGIPFPVMPGSARDHEHHRPGHDAERPDRHHDGRPGAKDAAARSKAIVDGGGHLSSVTTSNLGPAASAPPVYSSEREAGRPA
jgi:multiple sugar transport system substrate-binding protein